MNLILHPLNNVTDPVWSVIICVILAVIGTFYCIYSIMKQAFAELEEDYHHDSICDIDDNINDSDGTGSDSDGSTSTVKQEDNNDNI